MIKIDYNDEIICIRKSVIKYVAYNKKKKFLSIELTSGERLSFVKVPEEVIEQIEKQMKE